VLDDEDGGGDGGIAALLAARQARLMSLSMHGESFTSRS